MAREFHDGPLEAVANAEVRHLVNPGELGRLYREIREALPGLTLLGGCCGTDPRHITAIAKKMAV